MHFNLFIHRKRLPGILKYECSNEIKKNKKIKWYPFFIYIFSFAVSRQSLFSEWLDNKRVKNRGNGGGRSWWAPTLTMTFIFSDPVGPTVTKINHRKPHSSGLILPLSAIEGAVGPTFPTPHPIGAKIRIGTLKPDTCRTVNGPTCILLLTAAPRIIIFIDFYFYNLYCFSFGRICFTWQFCPFVHNNDSVTAVKELK